VKIWRDGHALLYITANRSSGRNAAKTGRFRHDRNTEPWCGAVYTQRFAGAVRSWGVCITSRDQYQSSMCLSIREWGAVADTRRELCSGPLYCSAAFVPPGAVFKEGEHRPIRRADGYSRRSAGLGGPFALIGSFRTFRAFSRLCTGEPTDITKSDDCDIFPQFEQLSSAPHWFPVGGDRSRNRPGLRWLQQCAKTRDG
jgi:hypothetical protein